MSTIAERFTDDAEKFCSTGFFGVTATHRTPAGVTTAVTIQFDEISDSLVPEGVGLNGAKAVAVFLDSDLPNVARGDQFIVSGETYAVMQLDETRTGNRLAWLTRDYAPGPDATTDGVGRLIVNENDFAG